MPEYCVRGVYKATFYVVLAGDEEITIDTVIEAENEKTAITMAIDETVGEYGLNIHRYAEVESEIVSDKTSGITAIPVEEVEPLPEEFAMRQLGTSIAPLLLPEFEL